MQVTSHDSGSAAAASHAKFKSDISAIANLAQSKVEVDKKMAEFHKKKDDESASSVPSCPEEDTSDQDDDMEFSSFMPVGGGGLLSRKSRPSAAETAKRRRVEEIARVSSIGEFQLPLPEEVEEDAPPDIKDVKAGKGNKQAEKIAKVVAMFEKKRAEFDDATLLQGKLRARVFTQLSKQLEDGARKIVAEPEYTEMSKQMLEFAEQAKAKWEMMQKLTKVDAKNATIVTDAELELIAQLRSSVVAKLILACATTLLKDIEDAGWSCGDAIVFFSVLSSVF